jgi:hypothetical protein
MCLGSKQTTICCLIYFDPQPLRCPAVNCVRPRRIDATLSNRNPEQIPLIAATELGSDAETLWQAADKLRGSIDAAEYKHVVLGLIFLKYISKRIRGTPSEARHRTQR